MESNRSFCDHWYLGFDPYFLKGNIIGAWILKKNSPADLSQGLSN
jgi:hypothetical protein